MIPPSITLNGNGLVQLIRMGNFIWLKYVNPYHAPYIFLLKLLSANYICLQHISNAFESTFLMEVDTLIPTGAV